MATAVTTIRQWLAQAHDPVDPEDARYLAMHVLALTPTGLFLHDERELTPDELGQLEALLARRAAGEPVAYLTGSRGFWSLELQVDSSTLIPRADTETLVAAALEKLELFQTPRVLDLGTGSGAIALAIARECPHAKVVATDRSEDALRVAAGNAAALGLHNVEFLIGNWFAALPDPTTPFDVIVSNPPYIRSDDPHLEQGDLRFEPITALASGPDGLDDLRLIIAGAAAYLNDNGWLLVEHGYDQGADVRALFEQANYTQIETRRDFGDNDRITMGQLYRPTIKTSPLPTD